MSFFRRKSPYDIDSSSLDRSRHNADGTRRKTVDEKVSKEGKKLTLLLIFNTLLAILIYFGCAGLGFWPIMLIYVGLAAVLLVAYVIYNRGFALRGVTPEMLPDSMSEDEKRAKLGEAAERQRASRWMMTIVLPLIIAVLFDVVYLYFLKDLIAILQEQL